jgi:IS30 family transposase
MGCGARRALSTRSSQWKAAFRHAHVPHGLVKSLTWDRGGEFAAHRAFMIATHVNVYFCDPRSPWQRGSNENTNGLLRKYLPTATNLSDHSQAQLDANRIASEHPASDDPWISDAGG